MLEIYFLSKSLIKNDLYIFGKVFDKKIASKLDILVEKRLYCNSIIQLIKDRL